MNTTKRMITTTATALAVAASVGLFAAPASASTPSQNATVSSSPSSTSDDFSVTLFLSTDGKGFTLGGYGTPNAVVQMLDADGTLVEAYPVSEQGNWQLVGGSLDGFGGEITVRQLLDGVVTDSQTIDLTAIPTGA